MFSSVTADSIARLMEAKSLLDICSDDSLKLGEHYNDRILYGSFYVLLYGALEYTISHCVYQAIGQLNTKNTLKLYELQPTLWGLIFDPDCTRMESAGPNKKWEYRYQLFSKLTKDQALAQIQSALFPASNGNIKEKQLDRVWTTFGLKSPLFEPGYESVQQDLITLANGRMAVAHGREKASTIGGGTTIAELTDLYDSISRYCSYLIACFTQYITNEEFKQ